MEHFNALFVCLHRHCYSLCTKCRRKIRPFLNLVRTNQRVFCDIRSHNTGINCIKKSISRRSNILGTKLRQCEATKAMNCLARLMFSRSVTAVSACTMRRGTKFYDIDPVEKPIVGMNDTVLCIRM